MKRVLCLILAMIFLSGCTPMEYTYTSDSSDTAETTADTNVQTGAVYVENMEKVPVIVKQPFSQTLEAEDFAGISLVFSDAEGYSGDGYVKLSTDETMSFYVEAPSSQHYDIGIKIKCDSDITIALINSEIKAPGMQTGGKEQADEIIHGAYQSYKVDEFSTIWLSSLFLQSGKNKLTLKTLKGISLIDSIEIINGESVNDNVYSDAKKSVTNKSATDKTRIIMQYLNSIYGKQVITGQYVTPNTNLELEAVKEVTGRYPAIRGSDLMYYTSKGKDKATRESNDTILAAEWAKGGGLVSYTWSWFAPLNNPELLSKKTDFNLDNAVTKSDVAIIDTEILDKMLEEEKISPECYALLMDIDAIALQLKYLQEKDVTVIWRPLAEAGNKWHWWGDCDNDSYIWLWKVMYRRMTELHGINNLIWVWNGESAEYYPGDSYVDIISEDVYNETQASNIVRFKETSAYTPNYRMVALSECALAPDPDTLKRDNAMWLWFLVWCGNYVINENGEYNEKYLSREELRASYNHQLTITLDELKIE